MSFRFNSGLVFVQGATTLPLTLKMFTGVAGWNRKGTMALSFGFVTSFPLRLPMFVL